jgi:hypothetical protein
VPGRFAISPNSQYRSRIEQSASGEEVVTSNIPLGRTGVAMTDCFATRIVRLRSLRIGTAYTLDFYDIIYCLSVFVSWYLIGAWLERRLGSTRHVALVSRGVALEIYICGILICVAVLGSLVLRFSVETFVGTGQELEISGLLWSVLFLVMCIISLRRHYDTKGLPSGSHGRCRETNLL